jgi:hypothetical protein
VSDHPDEFAAQVEGLRAEVLDHALAQAQVSASGLSASIDSSGTQWPTR